MREVFVNQDHARVGLFKSILEEAGIAVFVRNEMANNITEMPSPLFFPTLCVVRDEDYDQAMQILGKIYHEPPSEAADWRCPDCREEVPGTFDSCWQCGAPRPNLPTSPNETGSA